MCGSWTDDFRRSLVKFSHPLIRIDPEIIELARDSSLDGRRFMLAFNALNYATVLGKQLNDAIEYIKEKKRRLDEIFEEELDDITNLRDDIQRVI